MNKESSFEKWIKGIDVDLMMKKLKVLCVDPYIEVFEGSKYAISSVLKCAIVSIVLQLIIFAKIDWYFIKLIGQEKWYPLHPFFRYPYLFFIAMLSFYFWGMVQVFHREKLLNWLTIVFKNMQLTTPSGKMPSYVYDKTVGDGDRRILRLKKNGVPFSKFDSEALSQQLNVIVDKLVDVASGTLGLIDIYYSFKPFEPVYKFFGVDSLEKHQFYVGKSRTETIVADLRKTPHFLIGGATNSGKSFFMNQIITTLYLKNPEYTYHLIDLKSGTEFEPKFSKLPNVCVYSDAIAANAALTEIAMNEIKNRSELLKANNCQNIDELQKIPQSDFKLTNQSTHKKPFERMIIVVDEAHELFLRTMGERTHDVKQAKANMIKLSAQGRFVGIHIFIGTQRPDANSIDPLIKANLAGRICFHCSNFASSMTILDNGAGADLPKIGGRCIWKNESTQLEVQTLLLEKDEIKTYLNKFYTEKEKNNEPTHVQAKTKRESKIDSPSEVEK